MVFINFRNICLILIIKITTFGEYVLSSYKMCI